MSSVNIAKAKSGFLQDAFKGICGFLKFFFNKLADLFAPLKVQIE